MYVQTFLNMASRVYFESKKLQAALNFEKRCYTLSASLPVLSINQSSYHSTLYSW